MGGRAARGKVLARGTEGKGERVGKRDGWGGEIRVVGGGGGMKEEGKGKVVRGRWAKWTQMTQSGLTCPVVTQSRRTQGETREIKKRAE